MVYAPSRGYGPGTQAWLACLPAILRQPSGDTGKEGKTMAVPPAWRMPGLGPLESAIMTVIWEAGQPLTVRTARDRLDYRSGDGDDPAYTTIAAVMTNLWRKGLLKRARRLGDGNARAWWYEARVTREDHLAAIIVGAPECAPDQTAVLRLALPAASSGVSLPVTDADVDIGGGDGCCCGVLPPAGCADRVARGVSDV